MASEPSCDSSLTTNPRVFDVAVVGAGASGLRAAVGLCSRGRSVVVVEARQRIGGRLYSIKPSSLAADAETSQRLDLGATWFWPRQERTVANFVRDSEAGRSKSEFASFFQNYRGGMKVAQRNGQVYDADNQLDAPNTGRLLQGMAAIPDTLLAEFRTFDNCELKLGWPVSTIKRSDEDNAAARFSLRSAAGEEVLSREVVMALPPQLAVGKINFEPALPKAFTAVADRTPVWMADTVKTVVEFASGPFWRKAGLAGAAYDMGGSTGPLREIHDMGGPDDEQGAVGAIFGFSHPRPGEKFDESAVRSQMKKLYGSTPGYEEPSAVHIADWRFEEWTSPDPTGGNGGRGENYGHQVYTRGADDANGHVYWCSTETATSSPGHVEGALDAADRVIRQLLR